MFRTGLLSLALTCTIFTVAGCAPEDEGVAALWTGALKVGNTKTLNGAVLNGVVLNGAVLNGVVLNSANLGGIPLAGVQLTGVSGSGAGCVLSGYDDKGKIVTGSGTVGMKLQADLSTGGTVTLRIDHFKSAGADIYHYTVSYYSDGAWLPLCGLDATYKPIEAIALAGTWSEARGVPGGGAYTGDAARFTFACRTSALGKCTEWGYRRWASAALADHHQACTRMVRADYCGDGTPWTVDGNVIDAYDNYPLLTLTQPDWPLEAEWDGAGALCVASRRAPQVSWTTGGDPATCWLARSLGGTCGSAQHFTRGALLMDRHMP